MKAGPTTVLYRPVGRAELDFIRQNGFREFPPPLPGQPIFCPLLTREYAEQMARDWNAKDKSAGFTAFVTRFRVDSAFLAAFTPHHVGSSIHREYWIPAEKLADFNGHLRGRIEVIAEYHGVPDDAA